MNGAERAPTSTTLSLIQPETPVDKLFDAVAERAVAFGLVAYPDCANHELQDLNPAHFADEMARNAIDAFVALHDAGKSIDALLIVQWQIEHARIRKDEGSRVLHEITNPIGHAGRPTIAEFYARVVRLAHLRNALSAAQRVGFKILSGDDLVTIGPEIAALSAALEGSPGAQRTYNWSVTDAAQTWTADPVKLAEMADAPIVEGILRDREIAIVVGQAKTAKTWFALDCALCVASGRRFLDRSTRQRRVLYLDYELKPGTFTRRMSMLSPTVPVDFYFQCLRGAERLPSITDIAELVKREGFGLVVVDSLYRTMWLSEENSNDSTTRELTKLQTFIPLPPAGDVHPSVPAAPSSLAQFRTLANSFRVALFGQ
jgi:hypothetical protein